ncbi:MAG: hypothetical protein AAB617_02045 [Patescibacteria group bacterium]
MNSATTALAQQHQGTPMAVLPDIAAFCIVPKDIVSNERVFHIIRDKEDGSESPKTYVKHPGGGCDVVTIGNFASKVSSMKELEGLGLDLARYSALGSIEDAAKTWRGIASSPGWDLLLKTTAASEVFEEIGCVILPRNFGSLTKVLESHIPNQRREFAEKKIPHVRAIFACDIQFENDSPSLHDELSAHYLLTPEEICEFGAEFAPDHRNAFSLWFDAFVAGRDVVPVFECLVPGCVYCAGETRRSSK